MDTEYHKIDNDNDNIDTNIQVTHVANNIINPLVPHDEIDYDKEIPLKKERKSSVTAFGNGEASIFSCTVNLANTILGSGMLGLPHAFAECGYGLGLILLFISSIFSSFALHCLAESTRTAGINPSSFYSVANAALPGWEWLIDLAVAIKCFGVGTSYLIVVGDLMPDAMDVITDNSVLTSREFWVIIGFTLMAPLACFRKLDSLKFTSTLAIVFVFFLLIIVILYASDIDGMNPCDSDDDDNIDDLLNDDDCKGEKEAFIFDLGTMKVLSIFVFGFTCQQNIFSVCNELKHATQRRLDTVIFYSIFIALACYIIVAVSGFVTYGDEVDSDILESYPNNILLSIGRIFIVFLACFSYPLQAHPSRNSQLSIWAKYKNENPDDVIPSVYNRRYKLITIFYLIFSFLIGITVTDLGVILAIVGATGSTIVSYILPGIVYYKLHTPSLKRSLAYFQFCLGCIIIPLCLTFIFL